MCVHFHVGELSKTSTNNMVPSFKKKEIRVCVHVRVYVCVLFVSGLVIVSSHCLAQNWGLINICWINQNTRSWKIYVNTLHGASPSVMRL